MLASWAAVSKVSGGLTAETIEQMLGIAVGSHYLYHTRRMDVAMQMKGLRAAIKDKVSPAGMDCAYHAYANLRVVEGIAPRDLERTVKYLERVTLAVGEQEEWGTLVAEPLRRPASNVARDMLQKWCFQGHHGPDPSELGLDGLVIIPEGGHVPFLNAQKAFLEIIMNIMMPQPVPGSERQGRRCPLCQCCY
jgi:hypothetical protein